VELKLNKKIRKFIVDFWWGRNEDNFILILGEVVEDDRYREVDFLFKKLSFCL